MDESPRRRSSLEGADRVGVLLTRDQHRILIRLVDDSDIKGCDAAMIVSIQRALLNPIQVVSQNDAQDGANEEGIDAV